MSAVSSVNEAFKRVYGDAINLLPEDFPLAKDLPFSQKQKVGDQYQELAILTNETGFTLAGNTLDSVELNPSIAGVVKQTTVSPYVTVLPSILPWSVISRSEGAGDKAFFAATKHIVANNMRSHGRLQEILRFYGQSPKLLGYVSYATATYRGVSFTTGTATLNGVAFTNGINVASKLILMKPGDFAAGIWTGMEGVRINQVNSSGTIVASGKLVSVQSRYGYLGVDFVPVAATSTSSHRLCFEGMEAAKEYVGLHKILTSTGTLFGINTASYSLWQPNYVTLLSVKLTLGRIQDAIADAVNKGGLDGDLVAYLNPRSWATLTTAEAALRMYDESYKVTQAENGFQGIKFHTQTGVVDIRKHRMVMEGDCFILKLGSLSRSGSAEVTFTIPGMPDQLVQEVPNQTAYSFKTFSDQYIFCDRPADQILLDGINDESAT